VCLLGAIRWMSSLKDAVTLASREVSASRQSDAGRNDRTAPTRFPPPSPFGDR
jgi:hypothetical protein